MDKGKFGKFVELVTESVVWKIDKYDESGKLFEHVEFEGNLLCNVGIEEWFKLIATTGASKYDNANANLIVGTGTTAASASDTEATFTSGVKQGMMTGYPTVGATADHKCTWKASYGSASANQAWEEFGLLNAATGGILANRKLSSQGTKVSGQTWELTLEISLS